MQLQLLNTENSKTLLKNKVTANSLLLRVNFKKSLGYVYLPHIHSVATDAN